MKAAARPAATPKEVLEGLAVRHEAYARKPPLPQYQAGRLGSRREHRAVPWVLDRGDGTIVAALLCHPIVLSLGDRVLPAYGLGSVGTRVAERRRGHATALCRAACEASEREGRAVGLLFSSVEPAFYERLAFLSSPAAAARCDRLANFAASGPLATLVPVDPRRDAEALASAWRAAHRGTLHVHRDAARFRESVEDAADDAFLALGAPDRGYVRLASRDDHSLEVAELVLPDPADEGPALRAAARLAADAAAPALTGWLDLSTPLRAWFSAAGREHDHPMLRNAPAHASARFWASDHF